MTYLILSCIVIGAGVLWSWRKATSFPNRIAATSLVVAGVAGLLFFHPARTEREVAEQRVTRFCNDYSTYVEELIPDWVKLTPEEQAMRWSYVHVPMLSASRLCVEGVRNCATGISHAGPPEIVKPELARIATAIRARSTCPPPLQPVPSMPSRRE
jgi:hypothetical protein